ncbi:MAG: cyclase family protein [Paracoccaceae bacterium]
MCHACVTEAVKARMLSRRDLLRTAPLALGAGALAAPLAPGTAALAQGARRAVDMTHAYGPDFPTYFGTPGIEARQAFNFAEHGFNLYELAINEHTGTHIDAPLHFSADGASVDAIAVDDLVCPLRVIDIAAKAEDDPEATLTPDDLAAHVEAHGPVPDGAVVAMHSGWARHIGTPRFRGEEDGVQHYPGVHPEAALMLIEETGAVGLAVDTLSLDVGSSTSFETHYAWLPTGRYGIECVANLDRVPASGATLVVGAPKHEGGSGGPARLIALA